MGRKEGTRPLEVYCLNSQHVLVRSAWLVHTLTLESEPAKQIYLDSVEVDSVIVNYFLAFFAVFFAFAAALGAAFFAEAFAALFAGEAFAAGAVAIIFAVRKAAGIS